MRFSARNLQQEKKTTMVFNSLPTFAVLLITVLVVIVRLYYKWLFNHWRNKNVPFPWEPAIPFAHLPNPFTNDLRPGGFYRKFYTELKHQGHKRGVVFFVFVPIYYPIHPESIKDVLQGSNYSSFEDRGLHYNEINDPLLDNLLLAKGDKWRQLRAKLTPAFTPGMMKTMFDIMLQCCHQMQDAVGSLGEKGESPININEMSACYTTDVIGSCAFGIECNSFKYPNGEFRRHGERFFNMDTYCQMVKFVMAQEFTSLVRWLGMTIVDRDVTKFFINLVRDTVAFRRTSGVTRKDILQLLIKLADAELPGEDNFGDAVKTIAPEVFVFFMAGYHTSSVTLSCCLYELASNLDVQIKLRGEINQVLQKHDGKVTYDAVMEMKYMNLVVDETLRKYPSIPALPRECTKDYKFPDSEEIIEKGTTMFVPVIGLHYDSEYYPDPDKFDPERFTEENKRKRPAFTYLPFGDGPKICIGYRFALMQVKIGLTVLLRSYKFTLNKKTEVPLKFKPHVAFLLPKGIFLEVEKICGQEL